MEIRQVSRYNRILSNGAGEDKIDVPASNPSDDTELLLIRRPRIDIYLTSQTPQRWDDLARIAIFIYGIWIWMAAGGLHLHCRGLVGRLLGVLLRAVLGGEEGPRSAGAAARGPSSLARKARAGGLLCPR